MEVLRSLVKEKLQEKGLMDKFTDTMLGKTGLLAMIGKSERGPAAIEAIKKYKAAYLMAVGGAAYLVAKAVKKYGKCPSFPSFPYAAGGRAAPRTACPWVRAAGHWAHPPPFSEHLACS
jgi:hypothetical protein